MQQTNHTRYHFLIISLFLLLFSWQEVRAAGLYVPGRGVLPISRAGASIAGGDSLQSIWYNPANLVEMKGISILLDVGVINHDASFQRSDRIGASGETIVYDLVENQAPPVPDPSILIGYGWKKYGLTIAGGIYAPYAGFLKFPDKGAQRYALVDISSSLFGIGHLAVGWAPHKRIRVGAGIQNYVVIMGVQAAVSAYTGVLGRPEDPDFDAYTEASLSSWINISANFGVWGRVLDLPKFKLDVAASVQLPVRVNATGDVKVRTPTHALFDDAKVDGSKIASSFALPLIARGAIRASFLDRFNFEVAYVFEGWSIHDVIGLTPAEENGIWMRNVPTIGDFKVPDLSVTRNYDNAFSLRFGGSAIILPQRLTVHAGYTYETAASPDKTHSVFFPDANKHVVGIGFTFQWKKMSFDLSYAHVFTETRHIKDSEYKQINLISPEGAVVIGNGIYRTSYDIIGLSWRASY